MFARLPDFGWQLVRGAKARSLPFEGIEYRQDLWIRTSAI
jgi:hypothetical protein